MQEKKLPGKEALEFCLAELKKQTGPTTNIRRSAR